MANPNRRAVTVRLNLAEQRELAELCAYYKRDTKTVMKQALYLMVESTAQLKAQLKKEAEDAKAAADTTPVSELPVESSSEPAPNSGTESNGTDEAGN